MQDIGRYLRIPLYGGARKTLCLTLTRGRYALSHCRRAFTFRAARKVLILHRGHLGLNVDAVKYGLAYLAQILRHLLTRAEALFQR